MNNSLSHFFCNGLTNHEFKSNMWQHNIYIQVRIMLHGYSYIYIYIGR